MAPVPRPGRLESAKAAALELAREGGYDAVSMPKVSARSGVSRASLYQHFESKDHLVAAAFGEIAASYIPSLRGKAGTAPTAGERVLAFFDACIKQAMREPQFVDAYMRAWTRAPESVVSAFPRVFEDRIEAAIGEVLPAKRRNEVARVLEYVFTTLLQSIVSHGLPASRQRTELKMAVDLVLRTDLATPAGSPSSTRNRRATGPAG